MEAAGGGGGERGESISLPLSMGEQEPQLSSNREFLICP